MEELLNKLIEKGWKPFWVDRDNRKCIITYHKPLLDKPYFLISYFRDDIWRTWWEQFNIRELVAKESWLWQFVYDNWYNQEKKEYREWYTKYNMKAEYWDTNDYEYYLIESALCDEDKLEQFILDNIKIS